MTERQIDFIMIVCYNHIREDKTVRCEKLTVKNDAVLVYEVMKKKLCGVDAIVG